MRRLLLVPAVLLALTGCSSGVEKPTAPDIAGLRTLAKDPSHEHTTKRVTYPQTPPMGGPHWPAQAEGVYGWLRCGVYTEPVPNEFAVHSEEHGAVWLTYAPGATPAQVAALVALTEVDADYTLVSPYPGQPAPFMASTWGAQVSADTPDDPRLRTFTETYAAGGQGGEKGADCAQGTLPAAAVAAQQEADD